MKGRKWKLAQHFHGFPKETDMELVEEELPELKVGGRPTKDLFAVGLISVKTF